MRVCSYDLLHHLGSEMIMLIPVFCLQGVFFFFKKKESSIFYVPSGVLDPDLFHAKLMPST